ncbi:type I polyketide synthase [Streptomyces capillispiralis]|uniref:Acyl transferase domain-containing protein n=1 Tax=Streptomyces capillispiralis TaxID=68182 RepID=A0A561SGX4_9ACTN|nr:type I polyketide synthase [Streptomyces capillispiralis]TWF74067.1 acyl transferase domain-containing protein [Streptomyces capillispiralis]GHH96427.1 hypothetical protein GCM10017779_68840 [Streptomyces capillispiralis]
MTAAAPLLDADSPSLAVIGVAGRYPGARDVDAFWENLTKGVESVTRFPGGPSAPEYVPAAGVLEGADAFDAAFFGYSPREALILDPQQRLFLTCAWEALEDAGYDARSCAGAVGVYAGSSQTDYLDTLTAHRDRLGPVSEWQLRLATGIDFLTSRVAHRLGLTGPAVTVQTACSTSLVAIHVAAQALLSGECDLALAGGACVHVPVRLPEYTEGGVIAPDGHCRAFDARAQGTVAGNGVGVVVLKRLVDALEDGDHIRAVLRGTAVNNDGMDKVGFTAPGVAGQAEVIRAAHLVAGVEPDSIGYVETHGTGTPLGDPVELAALTEAFRRGTDRRGFCRIGSVKTNIGHTDAAAGVTGFIKAVLAVQHGLIPPSLHCTSPNPQIPWADGPFVVNTEPYPWRPDGPRRAGVSSFGIGGTNAHVILEEPPARPAAPAAPGHHLLVLSARTASELDRGAARLAEHLRRRTGEEEDDARDLADTAWTLQAGRRAFGFRRFVVAADRGEAIEALTADDVAGPAPVGGERPVVFVFPGQGGQHVGMGRELYESDPVFRGEVDACCARLTPLLGLDLRTVLYPVGERQTAAATASLRDMGVAQPAVFVVEYALARTWQRRGVSPSAVAGHSLGAIAAACVAGVLGLSDALRLVAGRGRLLQSLPAGAMLAVPLAEHEVTGLLGGGLELAAVNGPGQCVLSGPQKSVDALFARLTADGVDARRLSIAAAAHSALVEPVLAPFAALVADLESKAPSLPWVGDSTGEWVPMDRAPGADFWSAHMRRAVRFGDTLTTLFADPDRILLEVGPGHTLTTLARRHPARTDRHLVLPSLPHRSDGQSAVRTSLAAAGRLWAAGVDLDWARLHAGRRCRTALPTYPFSPQRYSPLAADGPAPAVTARPAPGAQEPARAADVEEQLARIFGQLLGLEEVAVQDDFFELGGDSLIAVQLVSAVRAAFGVRVTAKQVFTAATPRRLALVVGDAQRV